MQSVLSLLETMQSLCVIESFASLVTLISLRVRARACVACFLLVAVRARSTLIMDA